MPAVKIGQVALKNGLMLAPMAGLTDHIFRHICRSFGAEYTVSEMVSAKALCYEQRGRAGAPVRTAPLAAVRADDGPMAVQLFGSEPEFFAEAAARIASGDYRGNQSEMPPVAIDLNMGCPVAKVVSNGEGAALMRDPARAAAIVRAVKDAVSLPVTVKIRAGWDEQTKNAPAFARVLEEAGADLICVHGRTRNQFYQPGVDLSVIAKVKAAVQIPVIGNGDLFSFSDVRHILETTGCDGVMIGRGALGNPFIFREILSGFEGRSFIPPTPTQRLAVASDHAKELSVLPGGIAAARRHLSFYCRGIPGATSARDALMHAENPEQVDAIFERLLRKE